MRGGTQVHSTVQEQGGGSSLSSTLEEITPWKFTHCCLEQAGGGGEQRREARRGVCTRWAWVSILLASERGSLHTVTHFHVLRLRHPTPQGPLLASEPIGICPGQSLTQAQLPNWS